VKISKIRFSIYFIIAVVITVITILYFNDSHNINKDKRAKTEIYEHDLDIVYGSDTADLTIFLFSNYNCSFCRKFYTGVYPKLKSEYIDQGKIRLVTKPVALTNNESVINSLKIAVSINEYGNFEKLNELLLVEPKVIYTKQFNQVVEELIEKDDFVAECMYGGEAESYLSKNFADFKRLNCTGTPTFIINDKIIKGYTPYKKFKIIVEKELLNTLH
jgi:protein-disulfide isomerase